MRTKLIQLSSALAVVLGGLSVSAHDAAMYCGAVTTSALVAAKAPAQKAVPDKPRCHCCRKNPVSGGRVTLYAPFLQKEAGMVLFVHHGISQECDVVAWRPNSVTVDLPRLGLPAPQQVEILIVLPNGRVAKTFRVICEPPTGIVVHPERRQTPPVHHGCGMYIN